MAQEWYYTRGDQKTGPLSAKELKRAAEDGRLLPTDHVWSEGMKEWKEARTMSGLAEAWPSSSAVAPLPSPLAPARRIVPVAKPVVRDSTKVSSTVADSQVSVAQQWWLIAPCLLCCFPAGLVLVWLHPRLTPTTKWGITGVVALLFTGMTVMSQLHKQAVATAYADADRAWASGNKQGAVDKYRPMLDDGGLFLTDEQKPLVYGRVIDHDAESGNNGSAVKVAEKALQRDIEPSVNTPAGRTAVAEAKAKRAAERQVEAERAKQSGGGMGQGSDKPTEDEEKIQLIVMAASGTVITERKFSDITPEQFNVYVRSAAKALGCDKQDSTRHLLDIEPSSRETKNLDDGKAMIIVRYGPHSARTSVGFVQNQRNGRLSFMIARVGDKEVSPLFGVRDQP